MSYPFCDAIIRQFLAKIDAFALQPHVHAVNVLASSPNVIEIVVEPPGSELVDAVIASPEIVQSLYARNELKPEIRKNVQLRPTERTRQFEPELNIESGRKILPGLATRAKGVRNAGRLGFICILNGKLVCTSSAHVFCADGNESREGEEIDIAISPGGTFEPAANLWFFDPIRLTCTGKLNDRDFAVAVFRDDLAYRVAPELETPWGNYPKNGVTSEAQASISDNFLKVGPGKTATEPFRYLGTSAMVVKYAAPYFGCARFRRLAVFEKATDSGDSGSLVIHPSTGTALGLVVGLDFEERYTCVVPFWDLPWDFLGTQMINGREFPSFRTRQEPSIDPNLVNDYCGSDEQSHHAGFRDVSVTPEKPQAFSISIPPASGIQ